MDPIGSSSSFGGWKGHFWGFNTVPTGVPISHSPWAQVQCPAASKFCWPGKTSTSLFWWWIYGKIVGCCSFSVHAQVWKMWVSPNWLDFSSSFDFLRKEPPLSDPAPEYIFLAARTCKSFAAPGKMATVKMAPRKLQSDLWFTSSNGN